MIRLLRRLFCRHSYEIKRWHYTHGPGDNDPAYLEVEHVCVKCGKVAYSYPARNSHGEEYVLNMPEKQW